ncbi:MAG: MFS transporter [Hyphomicrobiales bacterium]
MRATQTNQQNTGNLLLILLGNAILGAPMPMLIILGGLAGVLLAPSEAFATLPSSIQVLSGLFAAAPMSMLMGRFGRKIGFSIAAAFVLIGGILGAWAISVGNFWMLCTAHIPLGAALVGFNYFRFAAVEVAPAKLSSVAISFTLGAGLFAALLGPEIFDRTKDLVTGVPFAGAYLSIAVIALAGIIPVLLLRLDPRASKGTVPNKKTMPLSSILQRPPVAIAILSGAISQAVMVLIMTPTPLAMVGEGFLDTHASSVIKWHVIAMFAPSFFTGFIIDRFGVKKVIAVGLAMLAISVGIAIAGLSLHHFYGALVLLGVGWNFGFIGATKLLAESVQPDERSAVQGTNDTLIALASTLAAFGSGAMLSAVSWTALCLMALPMIAIGLVGLAIARSRSEAAS